MKDDKKIFSIVQKELADFDGFDMIVCGLGCSCYFENTIRERKKWQVEQKR